MTIDVGQIAIVLIIIIFSMTLHEAMHAFCGYWLGDDTAKAHGRLTLNPLSHLDPFMSLLLPVCLAIAGLPVFGGAKPVPFNPNRVRYGDFGAALVGFAGPLTNLLIAVIAVGLDVALGTTTGIVWLVLSTTISVNLGFFVFNMLPIPPLDGSRLLYAVAPDQARVAMRVIEQQGTILVFIVVLLFNQQIGQFIMAAESLILHALLGVFGAL